MTTTLAAPKPTATAAPARRLTQGQHFDRTYASLKDRYKRVDERNRAALGEWRKSGGEAELQEIVAEKFPDAEFVTVHDVPVFAAHENKDRDSGRVVRYGRRELEAIAAKCNERILDTGDFAPLCDGHTPTEEMIASGAKMPDVLGYVGPYRVGVLGNRHPRWAIYADEHYHKSEVDRVRRLTRRSPEVWAEDRIEDRILDPIAALGAETPRLDLGIARFRRAGDGREVERYSAVYSNMPAGGNTFVPKAEQYAAGNGDPAMSDLSPEDVNAIVSAIQATKQWQWLTDRMAAEENAARNDPAEPSGGPDNTITDPGLPSDQAPSEPPAAPPAAPPAPTPAAPQAPKPPATPADDADMDDEEKAQYSALSPDGKAGYMAARRRYRAAQYSRRGSTGAGADPLAQENQRLAQRVAELETTQRQKERYHKLSELSQSFVFDLDDEAELCSDMTDEQFTRHVGKTVQRYARRDDPTKVGYLPTPDLPKPKSPEGGETEKERYSRRACQIADERLRSPGAKPLSFDEAFALAKQEAQPK